MLKFFIVAPFKSCIELVIKRACRTIATEHGQHKISRHHEGVGCAFKQSSLSPDKNLVETLKFVLRGASRLWIPGFARGEDNELHSHPNKRETCQARGFLILVVLVVSDGDLKVFKIERD
jgi:hypothetical protein